jgi:hypothetical protein
MTKEYFDKLPNGHHLMSSGNLDCIYIKRNNKFISKFTITIVDGIIKETIDLVYDFEKYQDIIIENKITNKLNRNFRLEQLQEKINEI